MAKIKINPRSLANLTPFKKGNPGGGRPPGVASLDAIVRKFLYSPVDTLPEKYRKIVKHYKAENLAECIQLKKFDLAFGDGVKREVQLKCLESLEYRGEGAPTQKTELTGKDGGAVNIDNTMYDNLPLEALLELRAKHEEILRKYGNKEEENVQKN